MIPNKQGTIKLTLTTAVQTVAIPLGGGLDYLFTNTGSDVAFVEFGNNNAVSVAAPSSNSVGGGAPITANQIIPYTAPVGTTHISLVSAGNSVVYVTLGKVI